MVVWVGWTRWISLILVLVATLAVWFLRCFASGEPPLSRLTLVPRYREGEDGRDAPYGGELAFLEKAALFGVEGAPPLPPGEVEVEVRAPEDSRTVEVETSEERLNAPWDSERSAFAARFFVSDRPPGPRTLWVRVVGPDGGVAALRLTYAILGRAPLADLRLVRLAESPEDLEIALQPRAIGASGTGIRAVLRPSFRHVEVTPPGGGTVSLRAVGGGVFKGRWRHARAGRAVTLHVVSVDRSLHEHASELTARFAAS